MKGQTEIQILGEDGRRLVVGEDVRSGSITNDEADVVGAPGWIGWLHICFDETGGCFGFVDGAEGDFHLAAGVAG